tara:strand:- start:177 stop:452 length:276 start_codon:yes stop_codon:yes gene_type:complete
MTTNKIAICCVSGVVLFITAFTILLFIHSSNGIYDHRFSAGDIVVSKLGERKGMVVGAKTYGSTVFVRFPELMELVRMQDFELSYYAEESQ